MAVAQIGTTSSFVSDTIMVSADMNANFTTHKDAFNSLVTGSNELAGGITVGGALTVASGGLTVTAGGITITAGGLDLTTDNITNVGTIGMGALTATTGTFSGNLTVSGTGPHVFGAVADATYRLKHAGNFTTDATGGALQLIEGTLTTTSGGDGIGAVFGCNITSGGGTTGLAIGTQFQVPTLSGTVTTGATVRIVGGTSGASTNYALWVDDGAVQIDSTLTVDGVVDLGDDVEFANATIALSGANHNVATGTVTVQRLNPGATANITGLAGGRDGRMLILYNVDDTSAVTLNHGNGSSTPANRMWMNNTADVVIQPHEGVILVYDSTVSRWYVLSPSPA